LTSYTAATYKYNNRYLKVEEDPVGGGNPTSHDIELVSFELAESSIIGQLTALSDVPTPSRAVAV